MVKREGNTEHWFVTFEDGTPSLQTASYFRRGAIGYWLEATHHELGWKQWYRKGMRVRRVKIEWQTQI